MSITRRDLMKNSLIAMGSASVLGSTRAVTAANVSSLQPQAESAPWPLQTPALEPGIPGRDYTPVITPDNQSLPFRIVDGVKVYHLIAEEVMHEFTPGLQARCWGYNGRVHGPTIEAVQGDRVRIYVTNRLPAPTTVHWHGVILPAGMDGVSALTQKPIMPGETFRYEWTWQQHGTYMYHSHHDEMTQMALGLSGMLITHPRQQPATRVDKDFAILLSEWRIVPGTQRPDPNAMTDFNVLTFNARAFPGTQPLVAQLGERVRIRFANISAMDHHPIHVHGYEWLITAIDGGPVPQAAQHRASTVLVPVGSTREVEFVADNPGDWAMHCHMTHHVMTQMGHDVPNVLGMDAGDLDQRVQKLIPGYMTMGQTGMGEMAHMHMDQPRNSVAMRSTPGPFGSIDMGGMFTNIKVRASTNGQQDPGWYEHPEGSVATQATATELARDGIKV